ncbi:MAG: HEPN domain-containing protein [Chloroflexota bacterium]
MTPSPRDVTTGSAAHWLAVAEEDLSIVRLAQSHREISVSIACFHAQQAAEKAIKAVLVLKSLRFPLVHDIDALCRFAIDNGVEIPDSVADSHKLTI